MPDEIHLRLNLTKETYKKRMQWKHMKAQEKMKNGTRDPELIESIIIRFMVDENGQYLSEEQARYELNEASAEEIENAFGAFQSAQNEAAIPNTSGSPSRLPSEVNLVDSPSPAGS